MAFNQIRIADKEHTTLGASNAERWMNCPGSIEAERDQPDPETRYAQEGTAAHHLAEMVILYDRDPAFWLDTHLIVESRKGGAPATFIVDDEMIDAVRLYREIVERVKARSTKFFAETRFTLDKLKLRHPVGGTSDCSGYSIEKAVLDVVDLKYGKGVKKEAADNPQLLIYALGVYLTLPASVREQIEYVRLVIVQPRIVEEGEPHVSQVTLPLGALIQFARDVKAAVERVTPDAPRKAGDWCFFCRAKGSCATFRGVALERAKLEFSDVVEQRLPLPTEFTPAQLGDLYEALPALDEWIKAVRGLIHHEVVVAGREIPGVARKMKTAHRKWAEQRALQAWGKKHGIDVSEAKVVSPAALEKACKARKVAFPSHLVYEIPPEQREFVLCSASDPKALRSGVSDFEPVTED